MTGSSRKGNRRRLAATMAVVLLGAACSNNGGAGDAAGTDAAPTATIETQEKTDNDNVAEADTTSITIGAQCPLTGGVASAGVPTMEGIRSYFAAVNAEGGLTYTEADGQEGSISFEVLEEDNAGEGPRAIESYRRQRSDGAEALLVCATAAAEALAQPASDDGLPIVANATVTEAMISHSPNYMTVEWPSYQQEFLAWAREALSAQPDAGIGLIVADAGFGHQILENLESEAPEISESILPEEVIPVAAVDTSVELQRLMDREPASVWIQHVVSGVGVVLQDAQRNGYRDDAEWIVPHFAFDPGNLEFVDEEALNGLRGVVVHEPPSAAVEGVEDAASAVQEHAGTELTSLHLDGWIIADALASAIKDVAESEGPSGIDGESINSALHSLSDWDAGGLQPAVTVTEERPILAQEGRLVVYREGRVEAEEEWFPMFD